MPLGVTDAEKFLLKLTLSIDANGIMQLDGAKIRNEGTVLLKSLRLDTKFITYFRKIEASGMGGIIDMNKLSDLLKLILDLFFST